jgi:hypothetical protein
MKKGILLFSAIALMAFSGSYAQEAAKKAVKSKKVTTTTKAVTPVDAPKAVDAKVVAPAKTGGAGMVFEQETIDYGTIEHNADGKREFVFTNNGTEPLVIESTQGSCGCTVPTAPKEPIAPGGKGVIGVKYATDRVGPFTKNVTIKSNAVGQENKVVTIKGTVLPDPASVVTTPAAPAGPTATPATPASKS